MKKYWQDDIGDRMEEAWEFAKAERELKIENQVIISIEYQSKDY